MSARTGIIAAACAAIVLITLVVVAWPQVRRAPAPAPSTESPSTPGETTTPTEPSPDTSAPPAPDVPLPASWDRIPADARTAIERAAEACRAAPGDADAMGRLARVYHGNAEAALARTCYRNAIALGADDARTWYLLGLVAVEVGDSIDAVECFRGAIERQPRYAPVHAQLGYALLDLAEIDAAVDAFGEAVRLASHDPFPMIGLGEALRNAERFGEAEQWLRQALALDPDSSAAHQQLGLVLQALGRNDEAAEHLAQVAGRPSRVVRDPWLWDAQQYAATVEVVLDWGRSYIAANRLDSAVTLLNAASVRHADNPDVFMLLGHALLARGDAQLAVNAYVRASDLAPDDDPGPHIALAGVLFDYDNWDDAEREVTLALDADPQAVRAQVIQGALAVRRDQPAEAVAILAPIARDRPDLYRADLWLGEARLALGEHDEAIASFQRVLEREPTMSAARRQLGVAYMRRGDLDLAEQALLEVAAEDELAREHLEALRRQRAARDDP